MLKVSRREFLGLMGGTCLFVLCGCGIEDTKKRSDSIISSIALQDYDLLICRNGKMLVKYEIGARTFTVNKLENVNNVLEETEIFQADIFDPNDGLEEFYNEYGVIDSIPAVQAFANMYGVKDYYIAAEVDGIIIQKNYQKVK